MPLYEYRCELGHEFEVELRIAEQLPTSCKAEECEAEIHQQYHPPAIHLKGPGFYNTDYGKMRSR